MIPQLVLSYQVIDRWLTRNAASTLRISIGVVFLWFGALKFFPALSPAEPLATQTLSVLTFGLLPDPVALVLLASFETAIGLLFVIGRLGVLARPMLYGHMAGTALPFVFFTKQLFLQFPYAPTFEAQYIFKNIIIVAAALTIRKSWPRPRPATVVELGAFAERLRLRESRTSVA
jgi:uncharacterized membrane protein YphA (DoxX/SURF4 family)